MTASTHTNKATILALALVAGVFAMQAGHAFSRPIALPDPKADIPVANVKGDQIAMFAGGCFWGVEAVFEHVNGVKRVTSGYAGGNSATARYEIVSTGLTKHAESVKIVYDPSVVSYGQLLKAFFSVAHDPTMLNRQGPDTGPQYRSEVFALSDAQAKVAKAYIAQLNAAHVFAHPIVTVVDGAKPFYPAEEHHQNYAARNPRDAYIVVNDAPKVVALKEFLPKLYRGG
ncbi:MAG: peptide-methionine (S)-S-oxide reductase MsrA [Luteimonas sp.]